MDLLSSCVVEREGHPNQVETLTYFIRTVHGRRLKVAVVTQRRMGEETCETSHEWKQFLQLSGYWRRLPKYFRNKDELQYKLLHFVHRGSFLPPITGCPKSHDIHFPDVLQFNVVWFHPHIVAIDLAKIPPCMHRHLLEHMRPYARLVYGTTSWDVDFNNCALTDGFANVFIENNIDFGAYALLRHVGNFTFELFMFDKLGFSLNLAGKPIGVSNPLHTPDDFLVYVESSFKDYSYNQLYCHPSFLFVPKKTSKVCCEAFLQSCSDIRDRVRIFYGDADTYCVIGNQSLRHQIKTTFNLKRRSTLFFVRHGRGQALMLVISSCGMEQLPTKPHVYEIRSAARPEFAEVP